MVRLICILLCMGIQSVYAWQPIELPLYPDGATDANGLSGAEVNEPGGVVSNVSKPALLVYLPENPSGAALLTLPGGGYLNLQMKKEGADFAPWFNEQGIAVVVLKYRLPNGHSTIPLRDALQAMKRIQAHAAAWKIDPAKIGVIGSSAGGHLAATLATQFTEATRPAFQVLLYPVISMDTLHAHPGSRKRLLGEKISREKEQHYSCELQVKKNSPPAFIALSGDDKTVLPVNSILYYQALHAQQVPAELHIYPSGGHGWAMRDNFTYKADWLQALRKWLSLQGYTNK